MLQFVTKLDYLLKETYLGLQRGGRMNWAAVSTIAVLLFLFGISLQTSWQLEKLLIDVGSQLEISVYLDPGAQAEMIAPLLSKMPEVADMKTITREQAWANLVQELGISDVEDATENLGDNPLVDEIKVKANHSFAVPSLATQLAKLQGVDAVHYIDDAVKRLAQLHQGLNWISLTTTLILTLTAITVTSTTIRLIVISRCREIEIMQLVGATSAWIYLPFILQGISFGVVGGAIAWGLISCMQQFLSQLLANQPEFIQYLTNELQLSTAQILLLPLILISFGATVGLIGSLFAVRQLR